MKPECSSIKKRMFESYLLLVYLLLNKKKKKNNKKEYQLIVRIHQFLPGGVDNALMKTNILKILVFKFVDDGRYLIKVNSC